MPKVLQDLQITSTDLVTQGANPDAHVRLFKRRDAPGEEKPTLAQRAAAFVEKVFLRKPDAVTKEATTFDENLDRERLREVCGEVWDFSYALTDSLTPIICDADMDAEAKREMMRASLEEFGLTAKGAVPAWANGEKATKGEPVAKSAAEAAPDAEPSGSKEADPIEKATLMWQSRKPRLSPFRG